LDLKSLGQTEVIGSAVADVAAQRERARQSRLKKVALVLSLIAAWLGYRLLAGNPVALGAPELPGGWVDYAPSIALIFLLVLVLFVPLLGAGRSPHILYRPSEIDVSFADVKGAGVVVEEVVKTLNLFLAYRTFRQEMGGTPRRAILFEGPPGTGKTYMAKAMAREAGVPFLFVSSSAFQSMYYGQTNRKIRSFFKALRRIARAEGGAIGFIEEIDAIGASRASHPLVGGREGIAGVVNELLIQLQSFDSPTIGKRVTGWFIDQINRWVPHERQIPRPRPTPANVLVIGATNRASDLDPALLRPGRFDRAIHFDLPSRSERREIIDYYLDKKAHSADLDDPARRSALAAMTFGYTPVMIEHLLDEALVWALRRGAGSFDWTDLQQAKLTEETGLKRPVEYSDAERVRIATHEAGHATIAHLVGVGRKLEVLSIIKRRDSLGLLAHSELEERFTKTRSELVALIQIAFGGMVAEEVFLDETSTGAAADLMAATQAAAQMVGALGMAGSLISYEAVQGGLGKDLVGSVLDTDEGRASVSKILDGARLQVRNMIESHRHLTAGLRDSLLAREELVGEEIIDVIEKAEREIPEETPAPSEQDLSGAITALIKAEQEGRVDYTPPSPTERSKTDAPQSPENT